MSQTNYSIDRAAAYGDGLFETIAIRSGEPRLWSAHLDRLQLGCARLQLDCPEADELRKAVLDALVDSGIAADYASVRLTVQAGDSDRGYRRSAATASRFSVQAYPAQPLTAQQRREGVGTRICTTRLAIQPALAGVKSLNRLEQVLARAEWDDPAVFEGLMLDTDGRLICGTMSNLFLVRDDVLVTAAMTRCGVSGIMRGQILRLAADQDLPVEVRDIDVNEVALASEIFVSNSQYGVLPVSRCNTHHYAPGPKTAQVVAMLAAAGIEEPVS